MPRVPASGSGDNKDNVRISFAAVGDENLVAVENPVLAIKDSRCFCAACVRTGIGFCKAKGTDLLTFGKGNEVFLLLFFCPKGKDRIGTQGYVSRKDNANTAVNTGQFLYGNGRQCNPCRPRRILSDREVPSSHFRPFP